MKLKEMLIVSLVILAVIGTGWVKNIVKLVNCDFESPYKCEAIHIAGLVPPIGIVTGWINISE